MPNNQNAPSLATTSPTAWVDLNGDNVLSLKDAMQEFSVLVTGKIGQGEFVVFSDDAVFQNRFLEGENRKLADNLSRWMRRGKSSVGVEI